MRPQEVEPCKAWELNLIKDVEESHRKRSDKVRADWPQKKCLDCCWTAFLWQNENDLLFIKYWHNDDCSYLWKVGKCAIALLPLLEYRVPRAEDSERE